MSYKADDRNFVASILNENAQSALERGGPPAWAVGNSGRPMPTSTDRWVTVTKGELEPDAQAVQFSLDTAELTVWGMTAEEVCEIVACWFLGATPLEDDYLGYFHERGHGARFYRRLLTAPGVKVYADAVKGDHVHIELEGSAMRSVRPSEFVAFVGRLQVHARKLRATRLDPAWDNCPFSPRTFFEAAKRGDVRCACKRRRGWLRFLESDEGIEGEWEWDEDKDVLCGNTCYLGRRGSERMMRCYDGRGGKTRLEGEWRGMRADALLVALLAVHPDEWSVTSLGHVLDFLTFCDRGVDLNVSRAAEVLLPWWGSFVGAAKRAFCRIKRVVRACVDAAKREAERAFRKVEKMKQVFGEGWVKDGLRLAREKYAELDARRVKVLRSAVMADQFESGAVVVRSHKPSWDLFGEVGGRVRLC